jgi:spermidine synthase
MTRRNISILAAATIVSTSGIIYELVIGTVSSYLLGNSVLQFSLTIGLFLFGMGIGSFLAPLIKLAPERKFVLLEIFVALLGGISPLILFFVFSSGGLFYLAFVVIVVSIGILIGFEIPTLVELAREGGSMLSLFSKVLAFDYLGALLASLLFPLFFLPYLGIVRTALLVGIVNILIAISILWYFKKENFLPLTRYASISFLTLVILVSLMWQANSIAWALDTRLYQDEIVYTEQTPYQKIVLTKFKDDVRLFLDGNIQFSSIDEYRYHEALVHAPAGRARSLERVLVLGGGDGLVARELLKYPEIKSIDLVDLDERVIELAKTNPLLRELNQDSLRNPRVNVVIEDAFGYLGQGATLYSLIVIDLPDPGNEALAKLYSVEFYEKAVRRLPEEGVIVTQATSPYFSNETFWTINETLSEAGLFTYPYHVQVPSFGEWGFVMGSKNSLVNINRPLPKRTRFLSEEILPSLYIFDKDTLRPNSDLKVNSLMYPIILDTYIKDAKRWQP